MSFISIFHLHERWGPQIAKTTSQARNQLETSGGAKSFPRGSQIFWSMSNTFF